MQLALGNPVTIILDYFELLMDRPSSLDNKAKTWYNYKQSNTVKYMVAITQQGIITFISKDGEEEPVTNSWPTIAVL